MGITSHISKNTKTAKVGQTFALQYWIPITPHRFGSFRCIDFINSSCNYIIDVMFPYSDGRKGVP